MALASRAERARPEQRVVDLGQVREAWGYIRLSLRSTAQPLYTSVPILSGSYFFLKWQSDSSLAEAVAALAGGVVPADRLELLRRRLQRGVGAKVIDRTPPCIFCMENHY